MKWLERSLLSNVFFQLIIVKAQSKRVALKSLFVNSGKVVFIFFLTFYLLTVLHRVLP